jgi:hypothetical protein
VFYAYDGSAELFKKLSLQIFKFNLKSTNDSKFLEIGILEAF